MCVKNKKERKKKKRKRPCFVGEIKKERREKWKEEKSWDVRCDSLALHQNIGGFGTLEFVALEQSRGVTVVSYALGVASWGGV